MKVRIGFNRYAGRCLFVCLFLFGTVECLAQGRPVSSVERRVETLNRQSETFEKDNMGGAVKGKRAERTVAARQVQLHIDEDLNALQDAYNKILVALNKAKDAYPQFAETFAAYVKKHALRLRSNLALAKYEDEPKHKGEKLPAASYDRLKVLTRLLYEFVTNPIFENLGTIEVEQSKRASKDLDRIIEVAAQLAG